MPKELFREIQKLEARLENFTKKEDEFVRTLKKCIHKCRELIQGLETCTTKGNNSQIRELINLRVGTIQALSEVLIQESAVEHEKSHLLESYGTLMLRLEDVCKDFLQ